MKRRFLLVICLLGMMSTLAAANALAAASLWANRASADSTLPTETDFPALAPTAIVASNAWQQSSTVSTVSGTNYPATNYPGTVTMPGVTTQEEKPAQNPEGMPESTPPAPAGRRTPPSEPLEPAAAKKYRETRPQEKFVAHKSVLQRFKEFTGERTVKTLTDLFVTEAIPGFSQTPPIALSDGIATVTLTVKLAPGDTAPNFALGGARLVSLKKNSEGAWVVEVLANKGVSAAVLTVIQDTNITEYPLTVAPPVTVKIDKASAEVSEADFNAFLKDTGTEKAPKYDLNGDGKRDYADDYIYTANWLVAVKQAKGVEKAPAK